MGELGCGRGLHGGRTRRQAAGMGSHLGITEAGAAAPRFGVVNLITGVVIFGFICHVVACLAAVVNPAHHLQQARAR